MQWLAGVMVLAVATSVSSLSYYSVLLEEWEAFKLKYGKDYRDEVEENFRMKIFAENKQAIAQHNQQHYLGESSFTLGLNQFGDMLRHEVVATMNGLRWNRTAMNRLSGATFIGPDDDVTLPESVDWRTKGAVTPVKDQGDCGSCWAFSATGSLEGQHFRQTGNLVSLSEQNLVDCATDCSGCNGGLMDLAFKYIKENGGIDTEDSYPYEAETEQCHYKPSDVGAEDVGYVNLPPEDEEALKKAVATVGPISVAIDASSSDFMMYSGGVFEDHSCSSSMYSLDHGVLVVGYGSEDNKDYWLVKNSWNTTWGEEGYIKMRRNFNNMCGIATLPSYPLV